MVTVTEVAARTGLSARRVRALIAAGTLPASTAGAAYLIDERDLDAFLAHARPAHVRAMAPRIAWAAAALLDGVHPGWLRSDERSRLRTRLATADPSPEIWRTWTTRLTGARKTVRASAEQVAELLADPATLRSGRSATNLVSDPLVGPVGAEVWVRSTDELERLRRRLGLLRSAEGNVTMRVPAPVEPLTMSADGENVFRLVVAADLIARDEPRAAAAGRGLLRAVTDDARGLR